MKCSECGKKLGNREEPGIITNLLSKDGEEKEYCMECFSKLSEAKYGSEKRAQPVPTT